jgi:hypothetical protein
VGRSVGIIEVLQSELTMRKGKGYAASTASVLMIGTDCGDKMQCDRISWRTLPAIVQIYSWQSPCKRNQLPQFQPISP